MGKRGKEVQLDYSSLIGLLGSSLFGCLEVLEGDLVIWHDVNCFVSTLHLHTRVCAFFSSDLAFKCVRKDILKSSFTCEAFYG